MNIIEFVSFVVAVVGAVALGIWKSWDEVHAEEASATGYILGGRGV
jgi:hypothetical protein